MGVAPMLMPPIPIPEAMLGSGTAANSPKATELIRALGTASFGKGVRRTAGLDGLVGSAGL